MSDTNTDLNGAVPDLVTLLEKRSEELSPRVLYRYLENGDVNGPTTTRTYAEMRALAAHLGGVLAACAEPRDRVLLLFPPGLDFITAYFGCLYAGMIAVPAYPPDPNRLQNTLPRLLAIVADAEARIVLTTREIVALAEPLLEVASDLAKIKWLAVDELPPADASFVPYRATPSDVAFLQYTSGSTGDPRGVMVTHANVLANTRMMMTDAGVVPFDTGVGWVPLYHDLGLIGNVLATLYVGGQMTFLSPLAFLKQPVRWLRAMSHFNARVSGGPDFAYDLCARKATPQDIDGLDLSGWEVAFNAAEPIRAQTLDRFCEVFAPCGFRRSSFSGAYGLAESTLLASIAPCGTAPRTLSVDATRLASNRVVLAGTGHPLVGSGRPVDGGSVVAVDLETENPVPQGRVGELWVAGPHVATGYWGRPDLSAATFAARLPDRPERWLRTGDLGFVDNGEVFVTGRLKDLIIVRGQNHYPQDLERTAESASPTLRPGCSAAFSLERDGHEVVVLVAEAEGSAPELARVPALVREAVARQHEIDISDVVLIQPRTISKTSSGKIQRWATRAAYEEGTLHVVARLSSPATASGEEAILAFLLERLRATCADSAHVSPDVTLTSLGIDSMQVAQLAGELERYIGRELPIEIFFGQSIRTVAHLLASGSTVSSDPGEPIDWNAEAALEADLRPGGPTCLEGGPILLTGASGFLGTYLLSELLERTSDRVICLVRAPDEPTAFARLKASLVRYGRWKSEHETRIAVLCGDLGLPRFRLSEADFQTLARTVGRIYHCGAQVNWAHPYHALKATNVEGTRSVLHLARQRNVPIHFVSSIGVYPIGAPSGPTWFAEEAELEGAENLLIGYFQSKWVAEKLLDNARRRGFTVTVYRPGFVTGDSSNGAESTSEGQLFSSFLRGACQLGVVPYVDKILDIVPVDYVAAAVALLSLHASALGRSFNLVNPAPMRQLDLYAFLRKAGWPLREVPYPVFRQAVLDLPEQCPDNPLARFAGYYRNISDARMQRLERQMKKTMPVDDRNTRLLLGAQVSCPAFDERLLTTYLEAYRASGTVSLPPTRVEVASAAPSAVPPESRLWSLLSDYAPRDDRMLGLYERAKEKQWNASRRIDWTLPMDPDNPQGLPDSGIPIYGSDMFDSMNRAEKAEVRRHFQSWQLSQFLHGEQGALLCASKIVGQAPTMEARLYAATQVVDEARHLEAFTRLLSRMELDYPVSPSLKRLLDDVLADRRWDMTMLGMQVLVEGLALAAFSLIRDESQNALSAMVNAYVMEDEARHVAFGRLTLQAYLPHLTQRERDEREEFVVEASYLLRDRFSGEEVWARLGLPTERCRAHIESSGFLRSYRSQLFSRIVPTIRAVGLWGERVRRAYGAMGVLGFAHVDVDALMAEDEATAATFEARLEALRGQSDLAAVR